MRRYLGRVASVLFGSGLPPRKRLLRLGASLCLTLALVFLVTAGLLALGGGSTRKPLPQGTLFSVPLSALTSPTPTEAPPTPSPSPAATGTVPVATSSPTPEPSATPTPAPTPPPSGAAVARLVIPTIKVDAPVSMKGVDKNGIMQDPNSWNDVAYYTFSGHPGFGAGNNAVFAGHVDYYPHRTAVFWDLNKLKPGDQVHVVLQDGTDYAYTVTQAMVYGADEAPLDAILGDTPDEAVTLITCDGTFANGAYNNRLVVRAERQPAQTQSGG